MERLAISPVDAAVPEIGRWLGALEEVRRKTIETVADCDRACLDWCGPDDSRESDRCPALPRRAGRDVVALPRSAPHRTSPRRQSALPLPLPRRGETAHAGAGAIRRTAPRNAGNEPEDPAGGAGTHRCGRVATAANADRRTRLRDESRVGRVSSDRTRGGHTAQMASLKARWSRRPAAT